MALTTKQRNVLFRLFHWSLNKLFDEYVINATFAFKEIHSILSEVLDEMQEERGWK